MEILKVDREGKGEKLDHTKHFRVRLAMLAIWLSIHGSIQSPLPLSSNRGSRCQGRIESPLDWLSSAFEPFYHDGFAHAAALQFPLETPRKRLYVCIT